MSPYVGAEYTPWRATNQLWWHNYTQYRADVVREVGAMRTALGFTSVRVFLHDMVHTDNPGKLLANLADFLRILDGHNMTAGIVFFDDCWQHAGANLSQTCITKQGVHNGCWFAGPQDIDRTDVARFEPYVTSIVKAFASDHRVAWWEISNEPQKGNNFSLALRDAGYRWATAQGPVAPVVSCWDDNNDTQVVDRHQYSAPWGTTGGVFLNPSKGGIVTEAGCRWFQQDKDHGSPLTVVNWLDAIRKGGSGAPFLPGVMYSWEVMVGNTATRWNWLSKEGDPEPAVPWCGSLYPDGTPVSYTEAAAFRRYLGRGDDFLYLDTFLQPSANAGESYLAIGSGKTWTGWAPHSGDDTPGGGGDGDGATIAIAAPAAGALYELSLWSEAGDGSISVDLGAFNVNLSITAAPRRCKTTKYLGCFVGGKRPGFILPVFPPNQERGDMSNELCASLCKDADFNPYLNCGTERGRLCMCGGAINASKWKVDENFCTVPCPGNRSATCGGEPKPGGIGDALSAYEIACTGGKPSPVLEVTSTSSLSASPLAEPATTATPGTPGSASGGVVGTVVARVDVADRAVGQGWNILRVLVEPRRIRVWLNPNFKDITGASVPPEDQAALPRNPPPLVDVAVSDGTAKAGLSATTADGGWFIDYAAVLPPTLFGPAS